METKIERYRRIRGAMLKVLAKEHPGEIDFKVILALTEDLGFAATESECEGHLAYLEEKGFVRCVSKSAGGIHLQMAAITANGIDLLDGLTEDVGVDARF